MASWAQMTPALSENAIEGAKFDIAFFKYSEKAGVICAQQVSFRFTQSCGDYEGAICTASTFATWITQTKLNKQGGWIGLGKMFHWPRRKQKNGFAKSSKKEGEKVPKLVVGMGLLSLAFNVLCDPPHWQGTKGTHCREV